MKALKTNLGEFSADALKARLIEKGRSPEEATQHVARVLDWDSENPAAIPLSAALIDENLKPRAHAQVFSLTANFRQQRKSMRCLGRLASMSSRSCSNSLSSLRLALWAAYENGVAIDLTCFDPDMFVGERVRREGEKMLKLIVAGGRVAG